MKKLKSLLTNRALFAKSIYGRVTRFYKLYILKDEFTIEIARWLQDKGDETLRLDYSDLNENSIVFDLGGYVGDFAHAINEKYDCRVYLFEPHPKFYDICKRRFLNNKKVTLLNYGLSDKQGEFILSDSVDGSSFLNPNHDNQEGLKCRLREFFSVLKDLDIKHVDLMKINVEGGEYPLLEHIAKHDSLDKINNYQIQFHNFIENAVSRRKNIAQSLNQTHTRTWCYAFVWENWKKS